MPKKSFFYLVAGLVIGIALTVAVLAVFNKRPVQQQGTVPVSIAAQVPVSAAKAAEEPAPAAVSVPASDVILEPREQILEEKELPLNSVSEPSKESVFKPEFQKGMTYVSWSDKGYTNPESIKSMEQMASLGVDWTALIVTQYQDTYDSTRVYPAKGKTATDESLIFAIKKLHDLKFKIMLKPHLDLVNSNGKWRGEIGFTDQAGWDEWFKSYTAFILHYAAIAAAENVEQFCIGTELSNATVSQPALWRELIKKIREIYKGKLTYAANWDEEFERIEFWDALDYAGVDSYFFLVAPSKPSVEQLTDVWNDWIRIIEAWQKKINKPVIFTEVGYKSSAGSVDEPWQHATVGELDLELQVKCYKALLQSFWDKPWFYGVYWWYWGVNPRMGGVENKGFTPQNKPVESVIKEWYKDKPITGKAY